MAGIGEASAILGVAQLGLQLAQTLVTVIGDYRDAAVNINRVRDEIHLMSISLQQLGDLAKNNSLLPGRGVLEATNLRERCRAVIWEIRTVVKKKSDDPLHPDEITKEEIDVSYFTAWKWALWTKKHLEAPRAELDRLKDSLTLTFVTHMAILGSRHDRERYRRQIPGLRRTCDWAEERLRETDNQDDLKEPDIPAEILNARPEEWQQFLSWKTSQASNDSADDPPRDNVSPAAADQPPQDPQQQARPSKGATKHEFWTLHPMAGAARLPMKPGVTYTQAKDQIVRTWTKLDPWYSTQVDALVQQLNGEMTHEWVVTGLKILREPFWRGLSRPPSLQVYLRGDPRKFSLAPMQSRIGKTSTTVEEHISEIANKDAVPYSETIPIDMPQPGEEEQSQKLSDEDLIEKQLALYQQG